MRKKNHHFVPQFYLRRFGSSQRAVNMFSFSARKFIHGASIRHQCARTNFYGEFEDLEDSFMELESKAAELLVRVVAERALPQQASAEYTLLLMFIAFQKQRTLAARERAEAFHDAFQRAVAEEDPDPKSEREWRRRLRTSDAQSLAITLRIAPSAARMLLDLEPRLLLAEDKTPFITSDSPVQFYNQYAEKVKAWGVLGAGSIGLQVAFPMAPGVLLLLYDRSIYRDTRKHRSIAVRVRASDVEQLNLLQAIGAHHACFLPPALTEQSALRLAAAADAHRPSLGWQFNKGDEVSTSGRAREGTSVLIASFERNFDIALRLDFLAVQRGPSREDPVSRGYGARLLAARTASPPVSRGPTEQRTWRMRDEPS